MLGSSNETSMYLSPRLAASRARYCSEEWWERERERGRGGEREREREGEGERKRDRGREKGGGGS